MGYFICFVVGGIFGFTCAAMCSASSAAEDKAQKRD